MQRECIFCDIAAGRAPASCVWQDSEFMAFLDIFPARVGHMLVIPRAHSPRVDGVGEAANARLWAVGRRAAAALRASAIPCDDVNFLLNDGPAANQTVPHVHLHVVPRVRGDILRMLGMLLRRPFEPKLGPTPRYHLDAVADEVRRAFEGLPAPAC